jgi:RloB-like protein
MARRRRTAADYARRGPAREPYDLVLIVCEGEKTEPFYFDGLRVAERLSSANIKVTPADGSDPMSIVEYAERFIDDYDRVFCVFDRDGHANYDAAVQRIARSPHSRLNRLFAIPSWPCFELWMLLHFRYSSGAIVAAGGRSSGEMALRELREFIPGYRKGRKSTYNELLPKRASAMTHAIRLQKENARTGANNPSTRVHELIDYLLNLR